MPFGWMPMPDVPKRAVIGRPKRDRKKQKRRRSGR